MRGRELLKSKAKASTFHILISMLVAACVGFAVFFIWYPSPFGFASGGLNLFLLVTAVDLVLGPALTFVAFNPLKRRSLLILDFSIIGILQVMALVYGVHAVFVARPVIVAYEGSRLRVVTAAELSDKDLKDAKGSLAELSLSGPKMVGTRIVTAAEQFDAIQFAMQGKDIGTRPAFWVEFPEVKERLKKDLKPMSLLLKRYPESVQLVDGVLHSKQLRREQVGFLPVLSKQGIFTALFSLDTGDFVAYLMLDGSL